MDKSKRGNKSDDRSAADDKWKREESSHFLPATCFPESPEANMGEAEGGSTGGGRRLAAYSRDPEPDIFFDANGELLKFITEEEDWS